MKNNIIELLNELKYNQEINIKEGLENRCDIDYVIERLEDIIKEDNFKKKSYKINGTVENISFDCEFLLNSINIMENTTTYFLDDCKIYGIDLENNNYCIILGVKTY